MNSREAFELWWGDALDEDDYECALSWGAWEARDAELAAKDARIAELEAALYCENSPYEAKTHRCVHCDEEVLR